ncbi:hypothetical protein UT300018_31740 [Clostridium faecium]|uniref:Uncharacterized protein n=2 Tax=Clostridium TaxID=1485 RepID=A0ABR8YVW0_9CLOT|nr:MULTISPECIES: hypothetical protein [Clostridium]MBD8048427.1 hypothetical protein [Clostridium faecium]
MRGKKTLSILIATLISTTSLATVAYANEYTSSVDSQVSVTNFQTNKQVYEEGDTKLVVLETENKVTVDVYVENALNHTSIVDKTSGEILEIVDGNITVKNMDDLVSEEIVEETPIYALRDTAPAGYRQLSTWSGHIANPSLVGYLWGKDSVSEGPAKHLSFSTGSKVGTIVGIIVGLIPGINAIAVITSLGGGIAGAVIGSAIDGNIYAIDYHTTMIGTVKNKRCLTTDRYTRYAKVINNKTGKVEQNYVGKYGN